MSMYYGWYSDFMVSIGPRIGKGNEGNSGENSTTTGRSKGPHTDSPPASLDHRIPRGKCSQKTFTIEYSWFHVYVDASEILKSRETSLALFDCFVSWMCFRHLWYLSELFLYPGSWIRRWYVWSFLPGTSEAPSQRMYEAGAVLLRKLIAS